MRISDWSSVVCSSDLPVSGQAVKDVGGDQRVVVKIILAVLIIAAQEEIQRPVEIRREAKLLADGFETIVLQHDEPAVNGLVERRQIEIIMPDIARDRRKHQRAEIIFQDRKSTRLNSSH